MTKTTILWAVGFFGALAAVEGCFKKFSNEQELGKAMGVCMQNLSMTVDDMPKFEDYVNNDFDDKCYGRCILEAMDMLTEAKGLDRDAVLDMIEENAPKPLVNKLTEAATKCSESSGVMKLADKNDCKPFAQFNGCLMTAASKLC